MENEKSLNTNIKHPVIQLGAEDIVEFRHQVNKPTGHPTPEAEAYIRELRKKYSH